MKIFRPILTICVLIAVFSCSDGTRSPETAARNVIERTLGRRAPEIELRLTSKAENGHDRFSTRVEDGRLVIEGSSGVAMTRGFYDYVTTNGYGQVTWTGTRMELPERLPDAGLREVDSPFLHHYYMNVCTFGLCVLGMERMGEGTRLDGSARLRHGIGANRHGSDSGPRLA